jgi:hypothetical protein
MKRSYSRKNLRLKNRRSKRYDKRKIEVVPNLDKQAKERQHFFKQQAIERRNLAEIFATRKYFDELDAATTDADRKKIIEKHNN